MKTIKTTTSDGILYNGLLFEPEIKTETIIVYIHGMSGDAYTDSFSPTMQAEYPKANISFLACEHRGTSEKSHFSFYW